VARIIGNELPPRDEEGSRIKSLQFILDNEKIKADRIWVLNRIHETERLDTFKKMLSGEENFVIPFVAKDYLKCRVSNKKIHYTTNINSARNFAFRNGIAGRDFVFVLDGDCFFESEMYEEATREIEEDQKINDMRYYGISTVRIESSLQERTEPMLIFRNDADQFFDETIPFGRADKIEFVNRIGLKLLKKSHVSHKSFSPSFIEDDVIVRMRYRSSSLSRLVLNIDEKLLGKTYL
jgi:hypothetical protein